MIREFFWEGQKPKRLDQTQLSGSRPSTVRNVFSL